MTLEVKPWNELSRKEINDIFSLRSEVFIVEQECAYQDVDGKDEKADHVMLYVDNELVGYTRVFPENTYFKEASFGRAVVKKKYRGEGYGHLSELFKTARNIYCVANCSFTARLTISHFTQNCCTSMNANPYSQRVNVLI